MDISSITPSRSSLLLWDSARPCDSHIFTQRCIFIYSHVPLWAVFSERTHWFHVHLDSDTVIDFDSHFVAGPICSFSSILAQNQMVNFPTTKPVWSTSPLTTDIHNSGCQYPKRASSTHPSFCVTNSHFLPCIFIVYSFKSYHLVPDSYSNSPNYIIKTDEVFSSLRFFLKIRQWNVEPLYSHYLGDRASMNRSVNPRLIWVIKRPWVQKENQ